MKALAMNANTVVTLDTSVSSVLWNDPVTTSLDLVRDVEFKVTGESYRVERIQGENALVQRIS